MMASPLRIMRSLLIDNAYVSDCHLPDEKLGKRQCGLVLYGEWTTRSGYIITTILNPVLLTLFLHV